MSKGLKLRAYDKYGGQHLTIGFPDDGLYVDSTSSSHAGANVRVDITLDKDYYKAHPDEYAEDPEFARWSDLESVEIIREEVDTP